jgi:hypothetical protein
MDNRYSKNKKFINNADEYDEVLDRKELSGIIQYERYKIDNFADYDKTNLNQAFHIYKSNEKLYNISQKFYGKPEYGWLILLTNQLSNPFELYDGKILKVIIPLEAALRII